MNRFLVSIILLGSLLLFSASREYTGEVVTEENTVSEVLRKLGDPPAPHQPNYQMRGVSVEGGAALVLKGITQSPKGDQTKRQSKHFVCTSCHNVQKEDPDLAVVDPQARLEYASRNGLPFLQGTTLYGVVNRRSFYNDDYEKKYGDLVRSARNDLRKAIQLCATECAQGRALEDWELESILAYLWTLELKMSDLQLTEEDYTRINNAIQSKKGIMETIDLVKSQYLEGAPAHFADPPDNPEVGYGLQGDPANGKLLYNLGCKHCHGRKRYSFFLLDDASTTFKFLHNHLQCDSRHSIYHAARKGTYPLAGKRAYMPMYPIEKMSHQQMEDLRAYIREKAEE